MAESGSGTEATEPSEAQERMSAMRARVLRTARREGASEAGLSLIEQAHALAMEPRSLRLADAHLQEFLHPGRTALILLMDVLVARAEVVAAGMLVETERPDLRAAQERVREALGAEVASLVAEVPLAGAEGLAEQLVVADEDVQRVALAERLDQLRHAHLWTDEARRHSAWTEAVEVYSPLAARIDPTLARRYRWWCSMFARNHLP